MWGESFVWGSVARLLTRTMETGWEKRNEVCTGPVDKSLDDYVTCKKKTRVPECMAERASDEGCFVADDSEADSGDGDAGGVGGTSVPGSCSCSVLTFTSVGAPPPACTRSVIRIRRWGYNTAVKASSFSPPSPCVPLALAAKTLVIWAKTPTSCTSLISRITSESSFSSLRRKAPR